MGLAALVLVMSAVPAAVGQSSQEDPNSIYQTTTMAFRVTGGAANDFSSSTQQAFANQLRALLPNVMSVAVSDFTVGPLSFQLPLALPLLRSHRMVSKCTEPCRTSSTEWPIIGATNFHLAWQSSK